MQKSTLKRILLSLPAMLMLLSMLMFTSCDQTPADPGNGGGGGPDTTDTGGGDNGGGDDEPSTPPDGEQVPDVERPKTDDGHGLVDTTGNTVAVSYTWERFDQQGWTLVGPFTKIRTDHAYNGEYSMGTVRDEHARELEAYVAPERLKDGVKIDSLSFNYYETSENNAKGAGGIRLIDFAGNMIVGAASDSPYYNTIGADGPTQHGSYPNTNDQASHWGIWVNVLLDFHWDNGTVDITFTDLEENNNTTPPKTYNVDLIENDGVVRIEIAKYGTHFAGFSKHGPQGDSMYFWVNNLQYWYTTGQ